MWVETMTVFLVHSLLLKIQKIKVGSFFLSDIGIKYLASHCLSIRELSVSDCTQITDRGLCELGKLGPNLRYLSVAKCEQITDAAVKHIARLCYKLRYLNVRGCETVSDSAIEFVAQNCTRLRSLDIGKCDITDLGLKTLSELCSSLKKLSVKSCEMVTDQGIQYVAYHCRGLQQLNIQDCPITIEGYRTIKKFCKRCIIEHTNPGFFWFALLGVGQHCKVIKKEGNATKTNLKWLKERKNCTAMLKNWTKITNNLDLMANLQSWFFWPFVL